MTEQLAAASDRVYRARTTGRGPRGALEDASVLVAAQRRRNEWVADHQDEIATLSRLGLPDRELR
jgi:hypothetical protein